MKTILLRFLVLLLFVPVFEFPATSQSNTSDALISGTLVDASGGAVSEVVVTATAEGQTGAPALSTSSKADGLAGHSCRPLSREVCAIAIQVSGASCRTALRRNTHA